MGRGMNTFQIVIKTVITTADVGLLLLSFMADVEDASKKALLILVLLNLTGVWI